jgi:hypothetical protein
MWYLTIATGKTGGATVNILTTKEKPGNILPFELAGDFDENIRIVIRQR